MAGNMTAPDPEAEAVAAKLTKAQRIALLWLNEDGSARQHGKSAPREVSFWAMANVVKGDWTKQVAQTYSLCRRSDGDRPPGKIWPETMWAATPLGLRVRNVLLRGEG